MKEEDPLQLAVDKLFLKLCEEGDLENLEGIIKLYKPKKTSKNPIFSYFLNIAQHFKASINPHCRKDAAFKLACKNSNTPLLDFLINIPNFVKNINENNQIYHEFEKALKGGNLAIAKYIHPLLVKNSEYNASVYQAFIGSCYNGELDCTKYLLNDPSIDSTSPNNWLSDTPGTHPTLLAGFVAACEGGQPHILKYFSSPEFKIEINQLHRNLTISNIEVMRHFIFDMGYNRNDSFMKHIHFIDPIALNDLFEKKELFDGLNLDLKNNNKVEENLPKKKPKI
jgi:hypothetical protein